MDSSILKSYKFEFETRGYVFLFNKKPLVDRACLLTSNLPEPNLVKFTESDLSLESIIDFVNSHAEAFLSPEKELLPEVSSPFMLYFFILGKCG